MTFFTMEQVRQANKDAGHHFFERSTMRFFSSKIASGKYVLPGQHFVTSEQFDSASPRLYTLRHVLEDGRIETVGEFQQYPTLRAAKAAIATIATAAALAS